jgi:hypothetical protein
MGTAERRVVAEWRTRGKDYLILYHTAAGYFYEGSGCGGTLEPITDDVAAVERMERPWGKDTGAVTVLRSYRPSLRRTR